MRKTRLALFLLLTVVMFATVWLQAQVIRPAKGFVIDLNRPFVYLRFDHIAKGEPRSEDEPATRIWFQLTNNCNVPIVISTFGVPPESPKDEEGVMYNVVPSTVWPVPVLVGAQLPPHRATQNDKQEPLPDAETVEAPKGYMFDVGSSESIPPAESVLFSVPMNHFGKRWHIEIPFHFDLPQGKKRWDPNIWGGQPNMVLEYSLYDLPPKYQTELEKK